MRTFAQIFRESRRALNLTNKSLSHASGLSEATLERIASGHLPNSSNLERIVSVMPLTVQPLLCAAWCIESLPEQLRPQIQVIPGIPAELIRPAPIGPSGLTFVITKKKPPSGIPDDGQ